MPPDSLTFRMFANSGCLMICVALSQRLHHTFWRQRKNVVALHKQTPGARGGPRCDNCIIADLSSLKVKPQHPTLELPTKAWVVDCPSLSDHVSHHFQQLASLSTCSSDYGMPCVPVTLPLVEHPACSSQGAC
jgi:hypothetical protein